MVRRREWRRTPEVFFVGSSGERGNGADRDLAPSSPQALFFFFGQASMA
nr:hypothetical protein Iba_chr15aCG12220 [Ipomoea batatas]